MSIDAVFLDIGGIILEIDWRRTASAIGYLDAIKQEAMWKKVAHWDVHLEFERGKISPEQFFSQLRNELSLSEEHDLIQAWNKLIVGPLPGVEDIFSRYKNKIQLIALSNTNKTHYDHQIESFSILKKFDRFVTSFSIGHRKPDPEIFIAAAELVGVKPERAVFIDDSLANVECARRIGFKAFQTVNSPIETLSILSKILKE